MGKRHNRQVKNIPLNDLTKEEIENIDTIAFEQYYKELHNIAKPIKMNFFSDDHVKKYGLKPYEREIIHYLYRTDPNNWPKMYEAFRERQKELLPNNRDLRFGISKRAELINIVEKFKTLVDSNPYSELYKNGTHYKYVLSKDYLDAVINAKKVGIFHYEPLHHKCKKSVDLVAMMVDGEVLIGEIATAYKQKFKGATESSLGGSVIFNIFMGGDAKYPIEIKRDDFTPAGCSHFNKIDKSFHLNLNKVFDGQAEFSHSHTLSCLPELPFTDGRSVNVERMPINKGNMGKENKYTSLANMARDSRSELNYDGLILKEGIFKDNLYKNLEEYLEPFSVNSKNGKLPTQDEFNEFIEEYNSSIKDEKKKYYLFSILAEKKEKENAEIARDIKEAYFKVTNKRAKFNIPHNSVNMDMPKESETDFDVAINLQEKRLKPSKDSRVAKEARENRDRKKIKDLQKYGIKYDAFKKGDFCEMEKDNSNHQEDGLML